MVPAGHHVRPLPVRVSAWDAAQHCRVLRVVGYRAVCSCGWRSPVRRSIAAARPDAGEHLAELAE